MRYSHSGAMIAFYYRKKGILTSTALLTPRKFLGGILGYYIDIHKGPAELGMPPFLSRPIYDQDRKYSSLSYLAHSSFLTQLFLHLTCFHKHLETQQFWREGTETKQHIPSQVVLRGNTIHSTCSHPWHLLCLVSKTLCIAGSFWVS